ncbi:MULTISPECIES: hypothetical protein [Haloferacaceae]|uniref:Uncharacterized protein n=1 Tax=Halorubrum glutamatedens TaxID=2707018 RepID=A0ABD5QU28_9EURY|nr:hypothetical protein [Halobellus captivus]
MKFIPRISGVRRLNRSIDGSIPSTVDSPGVWSLAVDAVAPGSIGDHRLDDAMAEESDR